MTRPVHSAFFTMPGSGRRFRIDVAPGLTEALCWTAFEEMHPGRFVRVPCWTREEEDRFPKSLARFAHTFCEQCRAGQRSVFDAGDQQAPLPGSRGAAWEG
ncbi:MAG: hypothetical protein ACOYXR_10375 [Nitrospirota bacterium]